MGVCMLIVSGATCLYHCSNILYNWGWRGQQLIFVWLPMYWAYLNSRVWVTCVSGTWSLIQKWLESFWLICIFDSHLFTYGYFILVDLVSQFPCSFVMNVRRLQMAPSSVLVGQLASHWGVGWAMWICGVLFGFSFSVPSLASLSVVSLPLMHVCALTLCT